MALTLYKPTTPARRHAGVRGWKSEVTKDTPEKSLLTVRPRNAGRNNQGKITVRHRGGGAKRMIRNVDFAQSKFDVPGTVVGIEYDPNRTAYIALLQYADGEKRYILAPSGLKPGAHIVSATKRVEVTDGNRMPLKDIPVGMAIHNLEFRPGRGGVSVRSAGSAAVIMAVEGNVAQVKMPSGEIRVIPADARRIVSRSSGVRSILSSLLPRTSSIIESRSFPTSSRSGKS